MTSKAAAYSRQAMSALVWIPQCLAGPAASAGAHRAPPGGGRLAEPALARALRVRLPGGLVRGARRVGQPARGAGRGVPRPAAHQVLLLVHGPSPAHCFPKTSRVGVLHIANI